MSSEPGQAQVQVAVADVNHFLKYLRRAVPICLEEDSVASPAFEAALSDKGHQEAIRKFISDPQTRSIFIQRSSTKGKYDWMLSCSLLAVPLKLHVLSSDEDGVAGDQVGESEDDRDLVNYFISSNVQFTSSKMNRWAIMIFFRHVLCIHVLLLW